MPMWFSLKEEKWFSGPYQIMNAEEYHKGILEK